ncbi:MAG: MATE family efflux transporter [Streptosporangiales bacterium]
MRAGRYLPRLRHARDAEIVRLAVPALGALVAEPLFLLGDSAIVGRLGTAPLGGLGVAGTVVQTVVNLSVFLAYGTTAAVARKLGASDRAGALRQGIDGIWFALALGFVLVCVGEPLLPGIVGLFGTSAEVGSYAVTYLRIAFLGLPAMLLVLAGTGVLRGLQDTRTPLLVSGVASAANVGLNAVLVLGLGWGIAGSAVGTVLAQAGSAVAYVAVTAAAARRQHVPLRPTFRGLSGIATAGLGLFVRTASLRVVLIVAAAVAARTGTATIAAYQVTFTIWSLLALALDSIAIAAQAITGRFLGAGDTQGTRDATRRMVEWGLAAGVVLGLIVLAVRFVLPYGFTTDPHVRALIAASLLVVACLQPLAGVVFALDGILIGAGDATYLAVAAVLSTLAFLPPAGAVLATHAGLSWLWWALGLWILARLVTLGTRALGDRWLVTGAVR